MVSTTLAGPAMKRRIRTAALSRLAALAQENSRKIYAWFLPPNHFQLLCKNQEISLSSRKHNPPPASFSQEVNPTLRLISIRHVPLVAVSGTYPGPPFHSYEARLELYLESILPPG
jgi:hypothetical protein